MGTFEEAVWSRLGRGESAVGPALDPGRVQGGGVGDEEVDGAGRRERVEFRDSGKVGKTAASECIWGAGANGSGGCGGSGG